MHVLQSPFICAENTCQAWHPVLCIKLLTAALHDGLPEEPPLHCYISRTVQHHNILMLLPQFLGIALVAGLWRGCKAALVATATAAGGLCKMIACTWTLS